MCIDHILNLNPVWDAARESPLAAFPHSVKNKPEFYVLFHNQREVLTSGPIR